MSSSKSMISGLTWMIIMMMMMQECRSCTESERQGLLELKAYFLSLSSDIHPDIARGWRTTSRRSCCSWRRVKCDLNNKRVTGLSLGDLYPSCYSDTLPILNLTFLYPFDELQSLNLSMSSLGGWFDQTQGLYLSSLFIDPSSLSVKLRPGIFFSWTEPAAPNQYFRMVRFLVQFWFG